MGTNPFLGFLKTLLLFARFRVVFIREDQGRQIEMGDGARFRVFRHVRIRAGQEASPAAVFIVRFRPMGVTVEQNIRFSLLPMMVFMGFDGFREKYWCVNDETGLCQGVYAWATMADAERYSRSIAMRFMTNRSEPGSVSFELIDQSEARYWLFKSPPDEGGVAGTFRV